MKLVYIKGMHVARWQVYYESLMPRARAFYSVLFIAAFVQACVLFDRARL